MTLFRWSKTAGADATADSTINWSEGQAPSSVNDSARAMMAAIAKHRDDWQATSLDSGSASAYSITTSQVFPSLALLDGQNVTFRPSNTNTAGVTLSVDGLTAQPIVLDAAGTAVPAGAMVAGTPYQCTYFLSVGAFRVWNFFVNPYNIPIGGGMDYWGSSVPNSNFAFPAGQAISRTTYAALFAIMGTTYGAGDGSTTFNLPDKTGRTSVMKEATATRLTTAGGGVDGGTMGAVGGVQNGTISQANLPNVNFTVASGQTVSGTVAVTSRSAGTSGAGVTGLGLNGNAVEPITGTFSGTVTNTGTAASGGSGTAFKTVQPTIVCNYILRII